MFTTELYVRGIAEERFLVFHHFFEVLNLLLLMTFLIQILW